MEQELMFGLDLGRLSLLKKNNIWVDYEQLLKQVFSNFPGQKKHCSVPKSYISQVLYTLTFLLDHILSADFFSKISFRLS